MKNKEDNYFDQEKAESYDSKFNKIAPMKDALHLLTQLVFSNISKKARMLCVGAGTGAEVLYLARHYENWHFDIVEPSEPMMNICREQVKFAGIESRCHFHLGDLDSFSSESQYDVATSFLVSHFFPDLYLRTKFFKSIYKKLRRGGVLVNADLIGDISSDDFNRTLKVWRECLLYSGMSEGEVEEMCASLGESVGMIKPGELEELIKGAGFSDPTLFYQALFIHSWFSVKNQ